MLRTLLCMSNFIEPLPAPGHPQLRNTWSLKYDFDDLSFPRATKSAYEVRCILVMSSVCRAEEPRQSPARLFKQSHADEHPSQTRK